MYVSQNQSFKNSLVIVNLAAKLHCNKILFRGTIIEYVTKQNKKNFCVKVINDLKKISV